MKVKVIVNPMARKGKAGKRWPEIEATLKRHVPAFDVAFTSAPGAATAMAREALAQGYDVFVPVGGDGTANEVLNGIVAQDRMINPASALCAIPAGTANELCRSVGLLADPEAPYRAVSQGRLHRLDMVRAQCQALAGDGSEIVRYGYQATSFGLAAQISYKTSASKYIKKLGGQFSYYYVTLIETITSQYQSFRIGIDDAAPIETSALTGLICNLEYGGGGMRLAPGASGVDGILDLIMFNDIARREILLQKPSWLFEGRHIDHPKVSRHSGRRFRITSTRDALVDADGEAIGRLPLTVQILPGALQVKVV